MLAIKVWCGDLHQQEHLCFASYHFPFASSESRNLMVAAHLCMKAHAMRTV